MLRLENIVQSVDLFERAQTYLETFIYENLSRTDANLKSISEEMKNLDFTIVSDPKPNTD